MKLSLQQKKMAEIHKLISQDLSYIYGERESGPNGAKKEFLRTSAAFLRKLGNDLEFTEMKVNTNKAGIAVSGEVTLYGKWRDDNCVFFEITQNTTLLNELLYREVKSLNDAVGGINKWLPLSIFMDMDYKRLCNVLLELKRKEVKLNAA